jgi:glucose 1-dehydrogenase
MKRFEGKVALVTGAAQGIGRAIAIQLAAEGARVGLNDVASNAQNAYEVRREIRQLLGSAQVYLADVSDREAVDRIVGHCVSDLGDIDTVVANAATSVRAPVVETAWPDVQRTIEVTQFGVYHTCRAVAQQMITQGTGGKIVIIGSILSEIPHPTSAAYNMAKAAVTHFGRTLAEELAVHKINVNVVSPGYVDTPGERKFATKLQLERTAKMIPWGRLGTGEDVAKAVAFLASDDADYITGSVLVVDGGLRGGMRLTNREG